MRRYATAGIGSSVRLYAPRGRDFCGDAAHADRPDRRTWAPRPYAGTSARRCGGDRRTRRSAGIVRAGAGHCLPLAAVSALQVVSFVMARQSPLRIGIGGPVGSGKTALVDALCKAMRDRYRLGVITNDIFTREDMEFLVRSEALSADRIIGVQTGGCPHTAIREDASMNFDALDELARRHPDLDLIFLESGGDNLAASFSPELVDAAIYVIDVSGGDKIPRKGGPGVTRSDLLVINKTDLAPHVGASLDVMARDAAAARGRRPVVFSNLKSGEGL